MSAKQPGMCRRMSLSSSRRKASWASMVGSEDEDEEVVLREAEDVKGRWEARVWSIRRSSRDGQSDLKMKT